MTNVYVYVSIVRCLLEEKLRYQKGFWELIQAVISGKVTMSKSEIVLLKRIIEQQRPLATNVTLFRGLLPEELQYLRKYSKLNPAVISFTTDISIARKFAGYSPYTQDVEEAYVIQTNLQAGAINVLDVSQFFEDNQDLIRQIDRVHDVPDVHGIVHKHQAQSYFNEREYILTGYKFIPTKETSVHKSKVLSVTTHVVSAMPI